MVEKSTNNGKATNGGTQSKHKLAPPLIRTNEHGLKEKTHLQKTDCDTNLRVEAQDVGSEQSTSLTIKSLNRRSNCATKS
jgi:hypothetical protein